MNKILLKTCCVVLTAVSIASSAAAETVKQVYCTTFPVHLFTRNIMKNAPIQPKLLLPANLGCPHDYAVMPQELKKVSGEGVLLVANGAGLDDVICMSLRKVNPKLDIFYASGETSRDDSSARHEHGEELKCGHNHASSGNAHLFASVPHAIEMLENITAELGRKDPENAELYQKNGEAYKKELEALLSEITEAANGFTKRNIIIQHNVFEYLAEDLNLKVIAVIQETPGENPSPSDLINMTRLAKKENVALILTEPQYPDKIAKTLGKETKIPVVQLDPVANGDENAPLDYFQKTMRANLEILKGYLAK